MQPLPEEHTDAIDNLRIVADRKRVILMILFWLNEFSGIIGENIQFNLRFLSLFYT
jgi:hypothetical protein